MTRRPIPAPTLPERIELSHGGGINRQTGYALRTSGSWTIHDDDGNEVFSLPLPTSEYLIRLVYSLHWHGYDKGKRVGRALLQHEFRMLLGVPLQPKEGGE